MKRVLVLIGFMFCCMVANADMEHDRQVGVAVHLSSIPEAYWGDVGGHKYYDNLIDK